MNLKYINKLKSHNYILAVIDLKTWTKQIRENAEFIDSFEQKELDEIANIPTNLALLVQELNTFEAETTLHTLERKNIESLSKIEWNDSDVKSTLCRLARELPEFNLANKVLVIDLDIDNGLNLRKNLIPKNLKGIIAISNIGD